MAHEQHLSGVSGRSSDGRALAHHRAPSPDLAPWVARLFVTVADQPADHLLSCGLFNDTAFVRVLVRGDWIAETVHGPIVQSRGTLAFGPHLHRMPVSVRGAFATFGFALRPGADAALGLPSMPLEANSVVLIESPEWNDWGDLETFDAHPPEHWLRLLEGRLRSLVESGNPPVPDLLAEAFDLAAFADPSEPIGVFAARHNVSERTVGRMARRSFGLLPKQVMRRARVLDMASQLLGFADRDEAEEHAARFYDQSHQIRDFRALTGMTPRELARNPQPILTLGLEPRQARRLETLGRLERGELPPWR